MAQPLLDWDGSIRRAGKGGYFLAFLATLPRVRWTEFCPHSGCTLLHHASRGANVAAAWLLLASGLFDINARDRNNGLSPADIAADCGQPRVLEVLCAAGANVGARGTINTILPLDFALCHLFFNDTDACVRVLLANGVRLSTAHERYHRYITPELVAFERGVLRCRTAVVVLLGLKWRRNQVMRELDRFVVLEIAVCVWATRTDKCWQSGNAWV